LRFGRFLLAHQRCRKEAVGAVLERRQPQIRAGVDLRRHVGGDHVAPQVTHGHHRELWVLLQECRDLVLVLGRQHRAGGVDQAAARLHQARGGGQDLGLLGHQLGQVGRRERPAAVRIAPPGARPGAGRIDQHAIEGALLPLEPLGILGIERAAFDIVRAGATQALGGAVEAALVDVHGHDTALVVHAGRDRQGLAAGTRAIVGDLHAGPAVDQGGHQLRALVLDLHQAVLERPPRHHRQPALEPQPVGRIAHRLGVDAFGVERLARLLDGGLEQIDPQVDRRRVLEGGDLAPPGRAVGLDQMRRDPLLHVEAHPVRLVGMGQRMALHLAQRAQFALVERRGAIGAAVERRHDVAQRHGIDQHHLGGDDGARIAAGMARALEPPAELAIAAQDAPDAIGHGAAVAAADEAAGTEERVGDQVGRTLLSAGDLVEQFDGGGNSGARSHVVSFLSPAATMNAATAQYCVAPSLAWG
jgi:hypothetical protein